MPHVFIPPQLRGIADGAQEVYLEGHTVGELVERLDERFPGIRNRLVEDGDIRPELSVTVDGDVSSRGLQTSLSPESEIHFLPAIGGG